jgi:hypothetical protein
MPAVEFESTISAGERRQTDALDRAATLRRIIYHSTRIHTFCCSGYVILLKDKRWTLKESCKLQVDAEM